MHISILETADPSLQRLAKSLLEHVHRSSLPEKLIPSIQQHKDTIESADSGFSNSSMRLSFAHSLIVLAPLDSRPALRRGVLFIYCFESNITILLVDLNGYRC